MCTCAIQALVHSCIHHNMNFSQERIVIDSQYFGVRATKNLALWFLNIPPIVAMLREPMTKTSIKFEKLQNNKILHSRGHLTLRLILCLTSTIILSINLAVLLILFWYLLLFFQPKSPRKCVLYHLWWCLALVHSSLLCWINSYKTLLWI